MHATAFTTTLYYLGCQLYGLKGRANVYVSGRINNRLHSPLNGAICSRCLFCVCSLLSAASEDANIYRKPPVYKRQGWSDPPRAVQLSASRLLFGALLEGNTLLFVSLKESNRREVVSINIHCCSASV